MTFSQSKIMTANVYSRFLRVLRIILLQIFAFSTIPKQKTSETNLSAQNIFCSALNGDIDPPSSMYSGS
ncbi:hypothetical protein BS333_11660 [Vibrio azureus]|nr:hypothetical protein BS333_11660 [Vibrio azureus]